MKTICRLTIQLCLLMIIHLLTGCDDPEGYYDDDELAVISRLTGNVWSVVWVEQPPFEPYPVQPGQDVYLFDQNGEGSRWVRGTPVDPDAFTEFYFQWDFTTGNMTVIYIRESEYTGHYWLIERFTDSELWVRSAMRDPVLYPSDDYTRLRLIALPD